MQERHIIFILILLGILLYVDVIIFGWSAAGISYPLATLSYISLDTIVIYFPRRLALILMVFVVVLNLWNIFNNTFLITNCKQYELPWGIFGENISYCTVRRLIYQTILSLMVSAAITLLARGTDNLFFCNVNIFRSTGTIDRSIVNEKYVESMKMERDRGVLVEKTNIELELR